MAAVIPDAGELKYITAMLNGSPENLTLKLYKTDVTPSGSSVAGDFTEADFTGYTTKTLTAGSWNTATTVSSKAQMTYASQTWTISDSGPQTIYGCYAVGATSGTLYFAHKFDAAEVLNSPGKQIQYNPIQTFRSEV